MKDRTVTPFYTMIVIIIMSSILAELGTVAQDTHIECVVSEDLNYECTNVQDLYNGDIGEKEKQGLNFTSDGKQEERKEETRKEATEVNDELTEENKDINEQDLWTRITFLFEGFGKTGTVDVNVEKEVENITEQKKQEETNEINDKTVWERISFLYKNFWKIEEENKTMDNSSMIAQNTIFEKIFNEVYALTINFGYIISATTIMLLMLFAVTVCADRNAQIVIVVFSAIVICTLLSANMKVYAFEENTNTRTREIQIGEHHYLMCCIIVASAGSILYSTITDYCNNRKIEINKEKEKAEEQKKKWLTFIKNDNIKYVPKDKRESKKDNKDFYVPFDFENKERNNRQKEGKERLLTCNTETNIEQQSYCEHVKREKKKSTELKKKKTQVNKRYGIVEIKKHIPRKLSSMEVREKQKVLYDKQCLELLKITEIIRSLGEMTESTGGQYVNKDENPMGET